MKKKCLIGSIIATILTPIIIYLLIVVLGYLYVTITGDCSLVINLSPTLYFGYFGTGVFTLLYLVVIVGILYLFIFIGKSYYRHCVKYWERK